MFKHAIVRLPGSNFAHGLTTVEIGVPDLKTTMEQHAQYCAALERCGLELTVLGADSEHPDSTFVEDTAVLTEKVAVLTRPGAASREGEVHVMQDQLQRFFQRIEKIEAPGTLDGGDICEAGKHFFIGISRRTNQEGGRQLAAVLARAGYTSSFVDIRSMESILHLKSGISYIGDNLLVVMEELAGRPEFKSQEFKGYDLLSVNPAESYAANCVRVNDHVLVPVGYPLLAAELLRRRYSVIELEMLEFQKMDGGLSCLSLRF